MDSLGLIECLLFMYSGVKECNYPNLEKLYSIDCWLGSRLEEIVSLGRIISIPGSRDRGRGTFESCENLKKVNFPTTIESIGERAFYNCTMLEIENISLPNLKEIGLYAFQGVKIKKWSNMGSITTVSFPGWEGGKTFGDISALEELIMPETLLIIENCGFKNYSNCKFKFSSSITSIGTQSFMNCSSIIDDVILPNLNTMGDGAFLCCTSLPTVSLSENISSIGSNAFESCTALQTVICKAVTPPTLGSDAFKNTNNCPIYVPDASVEAYKTATNWVNYADRIKSMFYYLGYIEFADPAVRDICVANFDTDGDGVVSMEEAAAVTALNFDWNTWQKFVTFNEFKYFTGVTKLNFASASNLKEYICPPSIRIVEGIGPGAEKFTLNEGITEFRSGCFKGNYKITNITIPSTTEKIGNDLFNTIPEWNSGREGTFIFTDFIMEDNGYYKAVDGILYNSAQTMLQQFPAGRTGSYITPPGVSLQHGCFGNSELSKIEVDSNVTTLPGNLFFHSKKLETIILNGITSISSHNQSFYFCNKLKSLIIKTQTVASLGASNVFSNDGIGSGTAFIYVPSNLVDSYKAAENWSTYASQIKPINVADTLPDISTVAENDLYKIGEVYWKAELVDSVLTWVEI